MPALHGAYRHGKTDIDVVVVRDGKNLKGRVLGLVLNTIGRHVLERAFENSIKKKPSRPGTVRQETYLLAWR